MSNASSDYSSRIDALDLTLFEPIHSQSSDDDKRSWLAVQRAVRRPNGYAYLEIGSYLGGSLQQHIVDPACRSIVSIDKRPPVVPDDRGRAFTYDGATTADMLDNLRPLAPEQLHKVTCFDSDASLVDSGALPERPDFCFIDGEHTAAAVISDFRFCLKVSAPDAAICFHDDVIIFPALMRIVADLKRQRVPFVARKIRGQTFGIFLRDCPANYDRYISANSRSAEPWLLSRRLREWVPSGLRPAIGKVLRSLRS